MTSTAGTRLGPVGQGADGLGPADAVHLVDAGDGRRGQDRRGQAAVRAGRRAQGQPADPGDPGRAGRHEHGGRQGARPPGTYSPARSTGMVRSRTTTPSRACRRVVVQLGAVVGDDVVVGHLQGGAQLGRDGVEGGRHLGVGDPQVVDGDAVELRGELPDGAIAVAAHPVEDGPHRLRGLGQPVAADGAGPAADRGRRPWRRGDPAASARDRVGAASGRPAGYPGPGPPGITTS